MSIEDAIGQAIYDVAVDHPMWIGDDGQPLDYLPEREARIGDFVNEAADAIRAHLAEHTDEAAGADPTRQISDLIDGTYPRDLNREAWAWRRVMKVAEEVGEVNEAMLGWLGENPRKGHTHEREDVIKELLDVAVAALGAVAHLDADCTPLGALRDHGDWVATRLRAALAGGASGATEGADG